MPRYRGRHARACRLCAMGTAIALFLGPNRGGRARVPVPKVRIDTCLRLRLCLYLREQAREHVLDTREPGLDVCVEAAR